MALRRANNKVRSISLGRHLAAYCVGRVGSGQRCRWPLNADPFCDLGRNIFCAEECMTRLADFVGSQSMAELYDRYWVPAALYVFARGLANRVQPGTHVLDLGTGTGLVAGYAS